MTATATDHPANVVRGIVCRWCGGRLEVYRVRKPCAGRIRRYKQCTWPDCDYRCVTDEKVVAENLIPERDKEQ